MALSRIKKGDEVIVVAGKDKGRRGTVLRVLDDERVLIENINVVKKHQKPNPNMGVQGGIIEKEMPLEASNVMLFNPVTQKGDRVGVRTLADGKRVRYFKSNDEVVDVYSGGRDVETAGVLQRDRGPPADGDAGLFQSDGGPSDREDHAQHGRW